MDINQIKKSLIEQGYTTIHDYDDPGGEYFADHSHEGEQKMFIVKGSMKVEMNNKEHMLNEGDELLFPAGMIHNATMGYQGCIYIVGEKS